MHLVPGLQPAHALPSKRITPMNPKALEIMREALERTSSIHRPTSAPAETFDLEATVETLDFAVITTREALDRASMPGNGQN